MKVSPRRSRSWRLEHVGMKEKRIDGECGGAAPQNADETHVAAAPGFSFVGAKAVNSMGGERAGPCDGRKVEDQEKL
jgi:hypothetical protein